jgi:hypothetical protein
MINTSFCYEEYLSKITDSNLRQIRSMFSLLSLLSTRAVVCMYICLSVKFYSFTQFLLYVHEISHGPSLGPTIDFNIQTATILQTLEINVTSRQNIQLT